MNRPTLGHIAARHVVEDRRDPDGQWCATDGSPWPCDTRLVLDRYEAIEGLVAPEDNLRAALERIREYASAVWSSEDDDELRRGVRKMEAQASAALAIARETVRAAQEAPAPDGLNLEDAHAALAAALLWLDGDYRDKPRSEFNREAWAATARKVLAALVAARQAQSAAAAVPEDGRPRLRDHPARVEAPAPEGLPRGVLLREIDDARNAGIRPAGGDELRAWNYLLDHFEQFVKGWPFPSPAEPPRPDGPWMPTLDRSFEPYIRDRAEARPPEGLDVAWAETMAVLSGDSNFSLSFAADGPEAGWYAMALRPPMSAHEIVGPVETAELALRALAARLSARGAEPR